MALGTPLPLLLSTVDSGYEIERSLRFNKDDSNYLDYTPSGDGSLTTWTWSCWVKRGQIRKAQAANVYAAHQYLFLAQPTGSGTSCEVRWRQGDNPDDADADCLTFSYYGGSGSTDFSVTTTAKYKDIAGWYHIVAIWNTTTATSNDRMQLWVNGSRVTSLLYNNQPTQNLASFINDASHVHSIGRRTHDTSGYVDGYLSEMHFVDGLVKDASHFGETDSVTGAWIPKEYTGSHGNEGFYLKFDDNSGTTATTLGKDSSGNGNNWTPHNFSVTAGIDNDCVFDTPTNNYCVLNVIDTEDAKISNGNTQTYTTAGGGHQPCYSTMAVDSGKWYLEYKTVGGDNWTAYIAPIRHDAESLLQDSAVHNTQSAQLHKGYSISVNSGAAYSGPADTWNGSYGSQLGTIGMLAFDLDNNKIYWGSDGTWYDSGDPAAGSNPAFSSIVVDEPFCFGASTSNGLNAQVNFGAQGFTHTPPTGFKALCSKNLPTPTVKNGKDYFNSVLYTSNATAGKTVTGVGFSPNLFWAARRNASGASSQMYDTVRGVGKGLDVAYANATEVADGVTSFDSDGVTLGATWPNASNGDSWVAWNWKESASAGFDIVGYSGNGSTQNVPHSLGVAPEFMIVKGRDTNASGGPCTLDKDGWFVYHKDLGNQGVVGLNENHAACSGQSIWNNTSPTSSVFSVGNLNSVNESGNDYIAYLWASVEGFCQTGSYEGNGSHYGPFVYTGFRPVWVLVKNTTTASSVWNLHDAARDPYNIVNTVIYPNTNDDEEAYSITNSASTNKLFLSNGFKIISTHDPEMNADGDNYIYLAFAESPFKYANAR